MIDRTIHEGTLIEGTHRPEDLIPAFYEELRRVDPPTAGQVGDDEADEEILESLDIEGEEEIPEHLVEPARELLEWLFDKLNEAASTEDMYFGAHPGDGSDFGYWKVGDED